ncbi:MAG: Hsp20/alpha crystallin family protein [candidate division Zixibacteria bacterium]|nr:Hsp20/alpha crystallin family protein [candidate division Zixibacteria bacterium]
MSITEFKKDLISDVRQIQEEMDLLFNQLSNWRKMPASNRLWRPCTDVWENDEQVVVLVELAGVKPPDVSISIANGVLIVKGDRRPVPVSEGCCFRNLEISTGRFERQIHLPESVDSDQVKAAYKNGLLEITIAKLAPQPGMAREVSIEVEE